ncbi:MAG: 6-phosphofructokinase [Clostridia bacterium]|nr:6-phosphofructokinase [Clostridia bacterium]
MSEYKTRIEEESIKRIGVLTSGGDAPGMNTALRAVVRAGLHYGYQVYGVRRGYEGLLAGEIEEMNHKSVSEIMSRGGTVLQTARCKEFETPEGIQRAVTIAKVFKLDALVVLGGDGSFKGARELARAGLPVIGIPCTIDNDIGCTDYTVGYDTALNTVIDAIDKIKDTACSHERCSVIEVMGRNAGYIAISSAISDGAEVCIIPEKSFDINEDIIKPIIACRNKGKRHFVVIIAEGVGGTMGIAEQIKAITGIATTATILGHIQRGGSPSSKDRLSASLMGLKAVETLHAGDINKVIALKGNDYVALDINEALEAKKVLEEDLIRANKILSL